MENSLAPFDLTDKVVMITGGGTGVGRATAVLMSAMGANVVVAGRRESLLDETVAEIEAQGGKAAAVIADVRRSADCEALVDRAVGAFGKIGRASCRERV